MSQQKRTRDTAPKEWPDVMPNHSYIFVTSCVNANGDDINAMKEAARSITRRTFRQYVSPKALAELESHLGYARHPSHGITMASDRYVGYWRSTYRGHPCVYFDWSSIEHIFADYDGGIWACHE